MTNARIWKKLDSSATGFCFARILAYINCTFEDEIRRALQGHFFKP
jgi:hypothetical protein